MTIGCPFPAPLADAEQSRQLRRVCLRLTRNFATGCFPHRSSPEVALGRVAAVDMASSSILGTNSWSIDPFALPAEFRQNLEVEKLVDPARPGHPQRLFCTPGGQSLLRVNSEDALLFRVSVLLGRIPHAFAALTALVDAAEQALRATGCVDAEGQVWAWKKELGYLCASPARSGRTITGEAFWVPASGRLEGEIFAKAREFRIAAKALPWGFEGSGAWVLELLPDNLAGDAFFPDGFSRFIEYLCRLGSRKKSEPDTADVDIWARSLGTLQYARSLEEQEYQTCVPGVFKAWVYNIQGTGLLEAPFSLAQWNKTVQAGQEFRTIKERRAAFARQAIAVCQQKGPTLEDDRCSKG